MKNNHFIYCVVTLICFVLNTFQLKSQNEVKLIFTGEVNVGNNYAVRYQQQLNAEKLFVNVTEELKSGVATFGTLGTVLIDDEGTPNKANMIGTRKLIRMSSEYAATLAQSGFSALSLANSHVSDFGVEGVQTTMNAMQTNKIEFAGLKSMQDYVIFDRNGIRFGFIAFGSSVHTLSMSDSTNIRQLITGLDDQCDIVVVAFSFNETVNSLQNGMNPATNRNVFLTNATSFAHTCIDAGADVVYGNGHNLPQPLELYKDKLIIYGLGNFCTPYGVSYTGELGAAPVIEANLFSEGTFKNGKIISYRQQNVQGPHRDTSNEGLKIIKSQTARFFPQTALQIEDNGDVISTAESVYALALKILSEAKVHLGKRYRYGTKGPTTFDCSGFTGFVFAKFGIKLNRSAAGQYEQGTPVDKKNLRPGDLVFFTRSSVHGVGHVGIVLSVDKKKNSYRFIHASVSKGITIDDFGTSAYYIKRYVGAKRVLHE